MDITKFPEGPNDIIKYMDYMPDDNQARLELLIGFMFRCIML